MSSPDQATSETTALLGDSRPSNRPFGPVRGLSPEILLIPVAVATKLASQIPLTTLVELVRKTVCRIWNASRGNSPAATLLTGAPSPPELCDAPEIAQHFAQVMTIIGVIEGLVVIVGCGVLSRVSSRYGRKPAFLILLLAGIMGNCMIPWSQYMPDWLADWMILVGLLFELLSSSSLYAYLGNLYIVDVCTPGDRTTALSKVAGWASLGTCISFALGGFITTTTGNPLIVFYTAAVICVSTFIYVAFVLPESFPKERRNAECQESSVDARTTRFALLHVFEPLKMLIPTRRSDGTYNWRLVWCATHTLVYMSANGYIGAAWLVSATSRYHLTPADTGLFLTIVAVSSSIVLTVIVPPLVRFLRPYYRKESKRALVAEEDIPDQTLEWKTSDRLDVHLAVMACIASAVFFLNAAAATTVPALIFSGICIGFISIHTPTTRSLVAGSVDPAKQGEALAAIEMASNAGSVLAPIIMGNILVATIGTMPLFVFYVHLVVVLVSGGLLLLVRDADGYQTPRET